jgi:hypothetical protein
MNNISWEDILLSLGMAIAGGAVRLMGLKSKQVLKWSRIVSELFVSGFTGVICLLLCSYLKVPMALTGVLCGMCGVLGTKALDWAAPFTLNLMTAIAAKAVGVDVDDLKAYKESKEAVKESEKSGSRDEKLQDK